MFPYGGAVRCTHLCGGPQKSWHEMTEEKLSSPNPYGVRCGIPGGGGSHQKLRYRAILPIHLQHGVRWEQSEEHGKIGADMDLKTGKGTGIHLNATMRCSHIHTGCLTCRSITSQYKRHDRSAGGMSARNPSQGTAAEAKLPHKQRGEEMPK